MADSLQNSGIQPPYVPSPNYQAFAPHQLTLTVIPMELNHSPYMITVKIKGNETSLKEVFLANSPETKTIFESFSQHKSPPSFRVYRKPLDVIPTLQNKSLHVLILKSEGVKFPRNPNSHILELFCMTYFYGPLVIAMNYIEKPYSLDNFCASDLNLLHEDNNKVHRVYPPPYEKPYPSIDVPKLDPQCYAQPGFSEHFYMYTYKTTQCPDIASKHDWTQCIYAHRFTDYRRNPQKYQYQPEDCPKLNTETGECPDGDQCKYSHSTAERLYHPTKYKTCPCDCFKKQNATCKRGGNCAFYHTILERRQPAVTPLMGFPIYPQMHPSYYYGQPQDQPQPSPSYAMAAAPLGMIAQPGMPGVPYMGEQPVEESKELHQRGWEKPSNFGKNYEVRVMDDTGVEAGGIAPEDPSTNVSDENSFEPIPLYKRHRWTVHTTQEKRMAAQQISAKSKFMKYWDPNSHLAKQGSGCLTPILSERDPPKLSSLVSSFCSSKGLPYYTEMAFNDENIDEVGEPEIVEEDGLILNTPADIVDN